MGKLEDIAKTLRSTKKIPFDGKNWTPRELIPYLATEVHKLRKTRCKPGVHCLFEYDEYLDRKYGKDGGDQPLV